MLEPTQRHFPLKIKSGRKNKEFGNSFIFNGKGGRMRQPPKSYIHSKSRGIAYLFLSLVSFRRDLCVAKKDTEEKGKIKETCMKGGFLLFFPRADMDQVAAAVAIGSLYALFWGILCSCVSEFIHVPTDIPQWIKPFCSPFSSFSPSCFLVFCYKDF